MKRRTRRWAAVCVITAGAACCVWYAGRLSWIGLWLTPDQQGRRAFERGDYELAAERFQEPFWRGVAFYRSGDYEAAVRQFAGIETAEGFFDLGDAYARLGRLEQARTSFEEALRRRPNDPVIRENLDRVTSWLREEKEAGREEPPPGERPTFSPDEVRTDEEGKHGQDVQAEQGSLSDQQIRELWMRRLRTTPAGFLKRKFAIQAQSREHQGPSDRTGGDTHP